MAKTPEERKAARREFYSKHREKILADKRENQRKRMRSLRSGDSEEAKALRERERAYRMGETEKGKAYREREKKRHREYFLREHDHINDLRKGRIAWYYDLKRTMKCAVCGQSFPDCPEIIDFHHMGKEKKENRIAEMVQKKVPRSRIEKEISKCVPLCANCHRRLHYLEREKKKKIG